MNKLFSSFGESELKIKISSLRKFGIFISIGSVMAFVLDSLLANVYFVFFGHDSSSVAFIMFALLVACGWWLVAGLFLYLATFAIALWSRAKTRLARIANIILIIIFVLGLPFLGAMLSMLLMSIFGNFLGGYSD